MVREILGARINWDIGRAGAALSPLRFSVAVLVREPRAGWCELTPHQPADESERNGKTFAHQTKTTVEPISQVQDPYVKYTRTKTDTPTDETQGLGATCSTQFNAGARNSRGQDKLRTSIQPRIWQKKNQKWKRLTRKSQTPTEYESKKHTNPTSSPLSPGRALRDNSWEREDDDDICLTMFFFPA